MVVKLRNTICPPPPQLYLHRGAALSSNSNGTRSVYSRKNPKSSLFCEISMIFSLKFHSTSLLLRTRVIYYGINFRVILAMQFKPMKGLCCLERTVCFRTSNWNRSNKVLFSTLNLFIPNKCQNTYLNIFTKSFHKLFPKNCKNTKILVNVWNW
jgi:hypothetical protein